MTDATPTRLAFAEHADAVVARLTLSDPTRRNALSTAMFDSLEAHLQQVLERDATVLAIEAEGPAFCAGFDLRAAVEEEGALDSFITRLGSLCRTLATLEAVVVAAVGGPALAGGAALVSACDLLLVSTEARIGYPAVRLGISPAVSLPTLMPAVGPAMARRLMLGGELLDGPALARCGWAHATAEDAEGLASLLDRTVERLAAAGPESLRATKSWCREHAGTTPEAFEAAVAATLAVLADEAGRETCRRRMAKALDRTRR